MNQADEEKMLLRKEVERNILKELLRYESLTNHFVRQVRVFHPGNLGVVSPSIGMVSEVELVTGKEL